MPGQPLPRPHRAAPRGRCPLDESFAQPGLVVDVPAGATAPTRLAVGLATPEARNS